MFKVGPNPYGICFTLGIQGNAPSPKDASWFLGLAESTRSQSIEFHFHHLAATDVEGLLDIGRRLAEAKIEPVISGPWPLNRIHEAFPIAHRLGVRTIRTHLSPVLCGARAAQGDKWYDMVDEIRRALPALGQRFSDEGLILAIENHQDFGSDEILAFCDLGGESVGICLDTGNPLAVAEEPIAFTRKVAQKVRHLHLKDYRAQATPEGFRLVRCPIGEGAIPFVQLEQILSTHHADLTASLEPGALQARHIRLLCEDWWYGYPERSAMQTAACLSASELNALDPEEDCRTPAEKGEDDESVCQFEMEQLMKSFDNMRCMGWLAA